MIQEHHVSWPDRDYLKQEWKILFKWFLSKNMILHTKSNTNILFSTANSVKKLDK